MALQDDIFKKQSDDIWSGLMSDDSDEGVFSALDFDHDSFLRELGLRQNVYDCGDGLNLQNPISNDYKCKKAFYEESPYFSHNLEPAKKIVQISEKAEVIRSSPKTSYFINKKCENLTLPPEVLSVRTNVNSARKEYLLSKLEKDISNGRTCTILRANIIGLRRFYQKATEDAFVQLTRRDGSNVVLHAVKVLQLAWRGFVFRHVYMHLRGIIRMLSQSPPKVVLRTVNPREAALADEASDNVVRFRLAADDSSPLPIVVYKIYTRRPVIDVCQCGLAHLAPRAKCHLGRGRGYNNHLWSAYKRVDNNNWRPYSLGLLFDAKRWSSPGRRWKSDYYSFTPNLTSNTESTSGKRRKISKDVLERKDDGTRNNNQYRKTFENVDQTGSVPACPPPTHESSHPNTPADRFADIPDQIQPENPYRPFGPGTGADTYYAHLLAGWNIGDM